MALALALTQYTALALALALGIFALTEHHLYADIANIKRQRDLAIIISAF